MAGLRRPTSRLAWLAASALIATLLACSPTATSVPPSPSASQAPLETEPAASAIASPRPPPIVIPSIGSASTTSPATPGTNPPGSPAAGPWQTLDTFPVADALDVTSAAPLGDGFVAVGFGALPGEGFYGPRQGIVWQSTDGRSWTSQADPAFQFVTLEKVVVLGDSLFTFGTIAMCDSLISDECVEPPEQGWAVWRSTGGGPWERLPQSPDMQHGTIDGVVATNSLLIAFGATGDDAQPVVWASPDGVTWTTGAGLPEMDQIWAMASAPGVGLIAFGSLYSNSIETDQTVAARSADGTHFEAAAAPQLLGATIRSATWGSNKFVAVGDAEDIELRLTTVALNSVDGGSWSESTAADGSFQDNAAAFVHAVPNGFLAVGYVPSLDEFGLSGGTSWFSADGQQWRAAGTFGGQFETLDTSAAGTPGVVAFTATSEEPAENDIVSKVSAWLAPVEALTALR